MPRRNLIDVSDTPTTAFVDETGREGPVLVTAAGPRRWKVSLRLAGEMLVEADSPEAAYELFKAAHNITGSDHKPEVTEVRDLLEG